jgi:ligand-binding SRPBCC domain-containing protein
MKTITTIINCDVETLFNFHLDSNNITKITPPNIEVKLLNEDTKTYEGKVVKIKTTKMFVPTYWDVEIQSLNSPNLLVDVALKSPFKYWKHQHIFTKKDENSSELRDIIEYQMPFGFIGNIFEPLIRKDIENMFDYRHIKTKEILESSNK